MSERDREVHWMDSLQHMGKVGVLMAWYVYKEVPDIVNLKIKTFRTLQEMNEICEEFVVLVESCHRGGVTVKVWPETWIQYIELLDMPPQDGDFIFIK